MSPERLWATELAGQGASWELARSERGVAISYDLSCQPAHTFLDVLGKRVTNQDNEQKDPTISKSLCFSKVFELLTWRGVVPRWPCRLGSQSRRVRSQAGSHHKIACFPSSFHGSRVDPPRLNVLISSKTLWCHRYLMCNFRCSRLPKHSAGTKPWWAARERSEGKARHGVQNPTTFSDPQLSLRFQT